MKIKNNQSGILLIEISVCIAITAIALTALITFFVQTNRLTFNTTHATNVFSSKVLLFTDLLNDLNSAKRSSLGSLIANGDFEFKEDDSHPKWWKTAADGNGNMTYLTSNSTNVVNRALRSVMLKSIDSTLATYTTTNQLTLRVGQAYMVSGWVRVLDASTAVGLLLTDTGSTVLSSSESITASSDWHRIMFRYPSTGTVSVQTGAYLRLSVQSGTAEAYFDDVQCSVMQSVLWSSDTAKINVESTPNDYSNPVENTGFRFIHTLAGQQTLSRYRITDNQNNPTLIREHFDLSSSQWIPNGEFIGKNIRALDFGFDSNTTLPVRGPDSPLTINLSIGDPYTQGQSIDLSNSSKISVALLPHTP